ncbi:uracil-DNA glycosylase family protein [Mesorhizobium sp. Cs1321R2N1]|uniref:uracil-DNA glycosylase family protein n=1 Tax=Mesorhizobium sp. Cs1321R2N1 TaxID=3015174 RepID=UPI003FA57249
MIERRNRSAFWEMVDLIDPSRRRIAWTNICKMDEVGGSRPPPPHHWQAISEPHLRALKEEIASLAPRVILFATSGYCADTIASVLGNLGYKSQTLGFRDGHTRLAATSDGAFAIETRHPQGWPTSERNRVAELAKKLLHRSS